jgi:heme-degrading monooxygenase HmoA
MFARKLDMYLKNDGALAFKERVEGDIVPLLRKQRGFLEQITFLSLNGREVQAFSLWETAEHAEAYNRETYPQVRKMLASVIEGTPRIQTYEVLSSTMRKTWATASIEPFDKIDRPVRLQDII